MTTELRQPGTLAANTLRRVWNVVNIYKGPDVFLRSFATLSEPEQHLYSTWWCDHEVCNGGFLQLFENSTGVLAPDAVVGYRAIGLSDVATTLEGAMRCLTPVYSRELAPRQAKVEEVRKSVDLKNQFDSFDEQYYLLLKDERFQRAADIYAAQHVI